MTITEKNDAKDTADQSKGFLAELGAKMKGAASGTVDKAKEIASAAGDKAVELKDAAIGKKDEIKEVVGEKEVGYLSARTRFEPD